MHWLKDNVGGDMVAVAMRPCGSFGARHKLFDRSNYHLKFGYDVSPDGKRIPMIRRDEGFVPRLLNVILNWSGEAEQPAPIGNKSPLHAEFAASSFHFRKGRLADLSSAIRK